MREASQTVFCHDVAQGALDRFAAFDRGAGELKPRGEFLGTDPEVQGAKVTPKFLVPLLGR
jgi:hypothetical protein